MEDGRFASRKFIITAVISLAVIPLVIYKIIDAGTYADITKWVLGLYFTGNVVEKVGLAVKS